MHKGRKIIVTVIGLVIGLIIFLVVVMLFSGKPAPITSSDPPRLVKVADMPGGHIAADNGGIGCCLSFHTPRELLVRWVFACAPRRRRRGGRTTWSHRCLAHGRRVPAAPSVMPRAPWHRPASARGPYCATSCPVARASRCATTGCASAPQQASCGARRQIVFRPLTAAAAAHHLGSPFRPRVHLWSCPPRSQHPSHRRSPVEPPMTTSWLGRRLGVVGCWASGGCAATKCCVRVQASRGRWRQCSRDPSRRARCPCRRLRSAD